MDKENKFFSLNHVEHFRRGFCYNITFESQILNFAAKEENGLFISTAFDSCELNMVWHRMTAHIESAENVSYTVAFYASNTKFVRWGLEDLDLDLLLQDECISEGEKAFLLQNAEFWSCEYLDVKDMLLHQFKGRYLWLKLIIKGCIFPKISKIRIYYPQTTFIRYLPESYQTSYDSFFVRFVAIFQSLYLELDEKIEDFNKELNPNTATEENLKLLASWIGLEWLSQVEKERLIGLMSKAHYLYQIWGTRNALKQAISILCGEEPFIREHFNINPFSFTVFISDKIDRRLAVNIIEAMKPAHTSYTLVQLKQSIVLNKDTYLGINSQISKPLPIRLDGRTPMSINQI